MNKNNLPWSVVIIVLLVFWPVGIYLLFKKLSSDKTSTMSKSSGKKIKIVGWVLIVFGGLALIGSMDGNTEVSTPIISLFMIGGGVMLLRSAKKTKEEANSFRTYINIIVNNGETHILNIASAVGKSNEQVKIDIKKMIDKGILPTAYIDESRNEIILQTRKNTNYQSQTQMGYQSQTQTVKQKIVTCPNCGANNAIIEGQIGECEYCATMLS